MNRFQQMQLEGQKEDIFKVAKQINDITFKYRIQNGGALGQSTYISQKYPNEVRVSKVNGLDMKPLISEKDINLKYEGFQCIPMQPQPEEVRADFPNIGSGSCYTRQKKADRIIHDIQLWADFTRAASRMTSADQRQLLQSGQGRRISASVNNTKPHTALSSLMQSPHKQKSINKAEKNFEVIRKQISPIKRKATTASQRETKLMNKMNEAREKFIETSPSKDDELTTDGELKNKAVTPSSFQNVQLPVRKDERLMNIPFSQEDKMVIQHEITKDDKFMRASVQSNRLRMITKDRTNKGPIDMNRWGFDKTSLFNDPFFDPLRMKILVMPYQDANPVGKNADYFFLKGLKCSVTQDYAQAMASYLKGLDIKADHLLCRFNLGVTLFTLGLFEEAVSQYELLTKQGYSDRPIVMYNKALCEMQSGKFVKAIESSLKCINGIIYKRKTRGAIGINAKPESQQHMGAAELKKRYLELNNSELEMLADMHVVEGLCNLRSNNIKKAGKCFDEAKQFKASRKCELLILIEKCLQKMIQTRILEHFKNNNVRIVDIKAYFSPYSQDGAGFMDLQTDSFKMRPLNINQPVVGGLRRKANKSHIEKSLRLSNMRIASNLQQKGKNFSRLSKTRNRGSTIVKIYLTDVDISGGPSQDLIEQQQLNQSSMIEVRKRRSHSHNVITNNQIMDELIALEARLILENSKQTKTPSPQEQIVPICSHKPQNIDELTNIQLMDLIKTIVSQKADPDRCYFYIDDEKTIRLDKLLDLPNSFEIKRHHITEKERCEKLKREAIEIYYLKSTPNQQHAKKKKNRQDSQDSCRSIDSEEKHHNFMLENYFHLKDRLQEGLPDQKKEDNEAFSEFLYQIRRFNQKLDLSLNYFLNEKTGQQLPGERKNAVKKMDSEIEQNIKEIKDLIVEQANKKVEVTINRLKLEELDILDQELNKPNKLDRNIPKIEELLMKLKAFKILNPQLRNLVFLRATYKIYEKNDVIYTQGEEGHYYYYMLRGSVSLLSNRADFGNFDLYLRSYYDGDCFGEQPQLFAKQQDNLASDDQIRKLSIRDSTCIANDQCIVLEVSNGVKHEFYRNDSTNQYERCLYWLRKNQIFKMTEGFYLLQMIFNIEKRVYLLGEALVRSGEPPEGMFIITTGQCRAVFEEIGVKAIEAAGDHSKPKNIVAGVPKQKHQIEQVAMIVGVKERHEELKHREENLKKFNSDCSVFNQLKGDQKKSFQSTRVYLDDEGKHMPNHIAYNDNINYGILVPGDSFGSRVLMPDDEIAKRMKPEEEDVTKANQFENILNATTGSMKKQGTHSAKPHTKPIFNQSTLALFHKTVTNLKTSALSIIADSKEVEVLILKTTILSYLPEQEKDKIYEDIAKMNDPDKPSSMSEIMRIKKQSKQWEGFRAKLVKEIRKSHKNTHADQ